jgi:uncharacterized metal-binding protein YceD (DUF177 family)
VDKLPSTIKPYAFAKQGLEFVGNYNLFTLPQVKNSVKQDSEVNITLKFSLVDNIILVDGHLSFATKLECAYCLGDVDFNYAKDIKLAFGNINTIIPTGYELVEIVDSYSEINTKEFIAEEVLLNLPMFVKHENECLHLTSDNTKRNIQQNPFATLKDLYK